MPLRPFLFGPWRRALQWSVAALVALIPFIRINDRALLRLDIPSLTLELAGQRFRIEELYLAWLGLLGLIFLFLLMAMTLGRVWCGWACPQTALSDLADGLLKKKALRPVRHLLYLVLSLWAGMTFVWYFISPLDFFSRLSAGRLGAWPLGAALAVAALTFLNFTFVRRLFCREFCPYGRFQTVLIDQGTLTLQAPPSQIKRCIDCKSCLRVCPTGIDIRQGYQIECISCARCLDACRQVMAKRGEEGIIRYTFGTRDLGWRSLLTPKTAGLVLVVLLLGLGTVYLASHRAAATFRIGRSSIITSRLTESGRQRTFFSGSITNRRQTPQQFTLTVRGHGEDSLLIKGESTFALAGNEKRDLNLAVDSPPVNGPDPIAITFSLQSDKEGPFIDVQAFLTPAGPKYNPQSTNSP